MAHQQKAQADTAATQTKAAADFALGGKERQHRRRSSIRHRRDVRIRACCHGHERAAGSAVTTPGTGEGAAGRFEASRWTAAQACAGMHAKADGR